MSLKRINYTLSSSDYKGLADADSIAYSYKTEGGIEQIDLSIKDKVDELESEIATLRTQVNLTTSNQAKDIVYETVEKEGTSEGTIEVTTISVKDKIDDLENTLNNVEGSAQSIAATQATLNSTVETFNSTYQSKLNSMQTVYDDFTLDSTKLTQDIADIKETADTLKLGFNSGTDFVVISQSEYDQAAKSSNLIYLIYDN